ncbi:exonuclease GOR isoform X2 [Cimex lectularius]|uniref:Exonuclease domain-containing protein n=1 Tax=Cimex lectularius TaxID=79782 RepID=A0A8I6RH85_CIMLE|nr:exonuclease GOR isoform X2 [Cimex lectularius]
MDEAARILNKTLVPLLSNYLPFFITVLLGWIIVTKYYSDDKNQKHETSAVQKERKKDVQGQQLHQQQNQAQKAKKKQPSADKWQRGKNTFSHDWLMTSLKGHGGTILDMDFSANGKFLATCGDDDGGGASSSGSEGNKENASPGSRTQLSRRQKKNKVRNGSPPTGKKKQKKRHAVLRQYTKLNLSDAEIFDSLRGYTLSPEDLFLLGYPIENRLYPGRALIFKNPVKRFDVNAKLFVPNEVYVDLLVHNGGSTFERRTESGVHLKNPDSDKSSEKKCVRCSKTFFISPEGEYLTQEHCLYHWGKLQRPLSGGGESHYTCCKGRKNTKGCTTGKLHVWNGLNDGWNGPYDGYVRTRTKKTPPPDGNYKVYALDCEMCYTTSGLELTKISVVTHDGRLIYDTLVKPESSIIDYNTRFSGVTAKDMAKRTKLLKDVQSDLMGFISADTILVGHGLENDLRALKMIHTTVIDTSIVFPHYYGLPYKRSLKSLVHSVLKRDIQCDNTGHDSIEDARSCLELLLWKLRKDRVSSKNFDNDLNLQ